MRKNYRTVNSFQNKRQADIIFESIKPKLNRIINEACDNCKKNSEETDDNEISDEVEEKVLNELFGSSSASKPAKVLTLDNSDAENAELFKGFGGHKMAAGLAFEGDEEKFEIVKKALNESVKNYTQGQDLKPHIKIDLKLQPEDITINLVEDGKNDTSY